MGGQDTRGSSHLDCSDIGRRQSLGYSPGIWHLALPYSPSSSAVLFFSSDFFSFCPRHYLITSFLRPPLPSHLLLLSNPTRRRSAPASPRTARVARSPPPSPTNLVPSFFLPSDSHRRRISLSPVHQSDPATTQQHPLTVVARQNANRNHGASLRRGQPDHAS